MQESLKLLSYSQMAETFGKHVFQQMRASFFCKRNSDVEKFIHTEGSKYEKAFNTRNYYIYDSQNDSIAAFFTLSLHSIILGDLLSSLDEDTMSVLRGYGKRDARSVGCYLIGQLARFDGVPKSELSGADLMNDALDRIDMIHREIGLRFVWLDCEDNESLKRFYESFGFTEVNKDRYCQMMAFFEEQTDS